MTIEEVILKTMELWSKELGETPEGIILSAKLYRMGFDSALYKNGMLIPEEEVEVVFHHPYGTHDLRILESN